MDACPQEGWSYRVTPRIPETGGKLVGWNGISLFMPPELHIDQLFVDKAPVTGEYTAVVSCAEDGFGGRHEVMLVKRPISKRGGVWQGLRCKPAPNEFVLSLAFKRKIFGVYLDIYDPVGEPVASFFVQPPWRRWESVKTDDQVATEMWNLVCDDKFINESGE